MRGTAGGRKGHGASKRAARPATEDGTSGSISGSGGGTLKPPSLLMSATNGGLGADEQGAAAAGFGIGGGKERGACLGTAACVASAAPDALVNEGNDHVHDVCRPLDYSTTSGHGGGGGDIVDESGSGVTAAGAHVRPPGEIVDPDSAP
jgi:hypothetical protein